jgi:hypothetical protein
MGTTTRLRRSGYRSHKKSVVRIEREYGRSARIRFERCEDWQFNTKASGAARWAIGHGFGERQTLRRKHDWQSCNNDQLLNTYETSRERIQAALKLHDEPQGVRIAASEITSCHIEEFLTRRVIPVDGDLRMRRRSALSEVRMGRSLASNRLAP